MKSGFFSNGLRFTTMFVMLVALFAFAQPAHAESCTVTSRLDDGRAGTLRVLLADPTCSTIDFAGDAAITLSSPLEISRDVSIDGAGYSAALSGGDRVTIMIINAGVTVNLNGLTLRKGYCNGCLEGSGGAIHNHGTLTVTNSTLHSNNAGNGGAIANSGTLTLTNVALSGNEATNYGGSILNEGRGTVTLQNSSISDSHAGMYGGGIYSYSTFSAVTLNNSTISGSSANDYGGAIFAEYARLTVTNSTISGNSSRYCGGVLNYFGTLEITDSTFSNNSAVPGGGYVSKGGAICSQGGYASGDGPRLLTVTNSTFSGNSATEGGAIYQWAYYTSGTPMGTVTGSTFSVNSATRGGAIEILGVGVVLDVTSSTFSGNSAASGAGPSTDSGAVTVTNSTFSGQQGPALQNNVQNNVGTFRGVATTTSRNSLLVKGTGDNCAGTIGGSTNLADDGSCGSGFTNSSSILLGGLGDYGGNTETIPLLPGSAAINAANVTYCPAADQRGLARVDTCDIGAFESQGFTLSDLTGTPQEASFSTAFATPLGLRVTANGAGEPVGGGQVAFTPPSSGASATITGSPATIGPDGTLSVTATANAIVGPYTVTASSAGATSADFSLNNLCTSSSITVQNANDSGEGSLREAMEQVCTGGTISFAGDTTIYLASTLTIGRDVTIDGGSNTVVLNGNTHNDKNRWDDVQVFIVSPGVTAALENLTVTNGFADCDGFVGCGRGGPSEGLGGGVYNSGTLTLTNVTLSNNSSGQSAGGAIFNDGGTVTLINSQISGSFAPSVGGAIYNDSGTVTLTNSYISGSFVHYRGAAIYNRTGTLNVTNSTFSANVADTDYGVGQGGAIYNYGGTVTLTNSTFSGNSGIDGGAIYSNGQLTITDSTFSGNVAYYDDWGWHGSLGGAIHNSTGTLNVTNSTFSANSGISGAGIYNSSGTSTVMNSLLVKSTGTNCAGVIAGSSNLADDATCGSGATESSAILLGPLGDYGGSTQTFPLLPGSPAINGTSSDCPATDQRGVTRGTTCDIGAFESQFTLTKLGGDNQVTSPTAAFGIPLLVGVTAAGNAPVDGGTVTFSAPSSGASAALSTTTVTIAGGQASVDATANEYVGAYGVTAGMVKAASLDFSLTNKGDTTTTLSSSLNASTYGDEVAFTAVVAINPPGLGEAGGTLTFYEKLGTGEDMVLSEAELSTFDDVAQSYAFTTSALSGGMHNIYAIYNGDAATSASTSNTVEQMVNQVPTITEQPASQTVYDGQPASFSVAALGYPTPTLQWQFSADGGATWSDIAEATASTYSSTASLAQNGYQYHAVLTNSIGSVISDAATLTVQSVDQAGADLGVTMTTNALPSDAKITYSVIVTNSWPSTAQTVVLSDPLPQGTAFVSARASQGTCNAKNKVITCKIGNLENGASVTVTLIFKRTDFTLAIVNTATVSSATVDPDTANNSATATVEKR